MENCSRELHRVPPDVGRHGLEELQRSLAEPRRDLGRLEWPPNPDRPPKLAQRDRLGSPRDAVGLDPFQILELQGSEPALEARPPACIF
jgi:hypothetical protein